MDICILIIMYNLHFTYNATVRTVFVPCAPHDLVFSCVTCPYFVFPVSVPILFY